MSTADWIIDLVLIGLVVLQLRERKLSAVQILLPIVLVGWATITYIHDVPTSGNSLLLIGSTVLVGLLIGIGVGMLTRVRTRSGQVVVKATAVAAVLWIVGMGSRLVFQLFATSGGGADLGRFDATNRIDNTAWPAALIFMAAATILARTIVLLTRVSMEARKNTPRAATA